MAWYQLRGSKTPMWFDREPTLELKETKAPSGSKQQDESSTKAKK